jgi:hypothetical protein
MILWLAIIVANTLAITGYYIADMRLTLGGLLLAGICFVYTLMSDNGPPE